SASAKALDRPRGRRFGPKIHELMRGQGIRSAFFPAANARSRPVMPAYDPPKPPRSVAARPTGAAAPKLATRDGWVLDGLDGSSFCAMIQERKRSTCPYQQRASGIHVLA